MINRILLSIVILGLLYLLFKLIRMSQLRTAQRKAVSITASHESKLLYFSSAGCSQCEGQEKILNQLIYGTEFIAVSLKKYTIEDDMKLAKQWGVKTLPTTILLSNSGKVKTINNGLISKNDLRSQLQALNTVNV